MTEDETDDFVLDVAAIAMAASDGDPAVAVVSLLDAVCALMFRYMPPTSAKALAPTYGQYIAGQIATWLGTGPTMQ